jgi:hypothetical protein
MLKGQIRQEFQVSKGMNGKKEQAEVPIKDVDPV